MQHFDGTENTAVKFPHTKVIERTSMTRYFTGNIDELRISKGVLAPSQFLKWSKKPAAWRFSIADSRSLNDPAFCNLQG